MLRLSYNIGNVFLHRVKLLRCGKRANERLLYPVLKRQFTEKGWLYYRIENKLEGGIPDILVMQNGVVVFVEVKYHRNTVYQTKHSQISDSDNEKRISELVRPQKELSWQRGQLGFMLHTIAHRIPYILCVYQAGEIAYYLGSKDDNFTNTIQSCAHFIERL